MVVFEDNHAIEAALLAAKSKSIVEWRLPDLGEPAGVKCEKI
jgi:hypothetical protein